MATTTIDPKDVKLMSIEEVKKELFSFNKELIVENPFYGIFFSKIKKKFTENLKEISTAGVCYHNNEILLIINTIFWSNVPDKESKKAIIIHELLHILYFHIIVNQKVYKKPIANIAMDIEINQYIPQKYQTKWFNEIACTLLGFNEKFDLKMEVKKGFRYYYDILKDIKDLKPKLIKIKCESSGSDNKSDSNNGNEEIDENDYSEVIEVNMEDVLDSNGDIKENNMLAESEIKSALKSTMDDLKHNKKYTKDLSNEQIEMLKELVKEPPKIKRWQNYLRACFSEGNNSIIKGSYNKLNKRYRMNKGNKSKLVGGVLVCFDSSGSISGYELKDFINESVNLSRIGYNVEYVWWDTNVHGKKTKIKSNISEIEVKGRGGTDPNCVINYANEDRKIKNLIIFTDGCFDYNNMVKYNENLIWVIKGNSNEIDKLQGKVITIN